MSKFRAIRIFLFILISFLFIFSTNLLHAKPILIILTDIGGDPDDQQSLVRLLVYANEFNIKGIILKHWKGYGDEGFTPQEQYNLTKSYINAYGNVVGNLSQHASGYPSESYLLSTIKRGGINVPWTLDNSYISNIMNKVIGPGKDTEGSDWIIQVVDNAGNAKVNIAAWGGTSDLAQALWKVKNTRSISQVDAFVSKLRVYSIEDQDDGGHWICDNFPDIFYVYAHSRDNVILHGSYRGMYLGGDESLTSSNWVRSNVSSGHGSLGNKYPMQAYTEPNPYDCMKEGDTPSWLYFLENGLNDPSHPNYGGWGGRFSRNGSFYQDTKDRVNGDYSGRATVWRWREDFQNDFAARMDWCVKSYSNANHNPQAKISGSTRPTVVSGELITLSASGSSDPDGNSLSYEWIYYPGTGSFSGTFSLPDDRGKTISFYAPYVSSSRTMHIILRVKDNGNPPLVDYERVILTINSGEAKFHIAGKTTYFDNDNPIPDARVVLSGGADLTSFTSMSGDFRFDNLDGNKSYSFRPFKSAGEDIGKYAIFGYDAALVARAAIELISLSSEQRIAADVDNDGQITLMDAVHISRYAVGLPALEDSHVAEWEFLPAHIELSNLSANKYDQNFSGIVLGNVHGNWQQPNGDNEFPKPINLVSTTATEVHAGESFCIPVILAGLDSVISFDLNIDFDPDLLNLENIESAADFAGFQIVHYENHEGKLKICAFGTVPVYNAGEALFIHFTVKKSSAPETQVKFSKLIINQNHFFKQTHHIRLLDFQQELPEKYALHQCYPNPFQFQENLSIDFSLPRNDKVEFFIFNTLGQIVRHFGQTEMHAGIHKLFWDGRNDAGQIASPGIYFYQMKTEQFSAVRKLLIVR
ncbi:MAG: DUF1593 domain-containing protein [Calditrichaeota bacterium]|nr:DUF1593 domain-containing protein [Calditrichota bacterium]